MYDHDPNSVQGYAVAYFLRWRCTALCDSKTAVLPGDGEQAHYKKFFGMKSHVSIFNLVRDNRDPL